MSDVKRTSDARAEGSDLAQYLAAVRLFSRNARLYLVHIVGMDLIHGTWEVLFNLYLLALFASAGGVTLFGQQLHPIEFVGLRLAVGALASGIGSLPAGLLSDRIGRKASFILGDGGGAVVALLNVLIVDPLFLLLTPIASSVLGSLHHVSETAFMAENSESRERVHLFSVGYSLSTAVGMVGALIAASHPAVVAWFGEQLVAYRVLTFAGIGLWFFSLVPALMLREQPPDPAPATADGVRTRQVKIGLGSIRHPGLVARLVVSGALLSVGYGAALPFLSVFFHEHLHAQEQEIGVTFAAVSGFVALGALLAPLVAARVGRVRGVVITRFAAVPFILALAFSPASSGGATLGLSLVGAAVALRAVMVSLSVPLAESFAMEILDPSERATMVGLESAAGSLLRAAASVMGAVWMAGGDFQTPFLLAAACYLASTALFWIFFRRLDPQPRSELQAVPSAA